MTKLVDFPIPISMQEQEILLSEGMPSKEVIKHLKEQQSQVQPRKIPECPYRSPQDMVWARVEYPNPAQKGVFCDVSSLSSLPKSHISPGKKNRADDHNTSGMIVK